MDVMFVQTRDEATSTGYNVNADVLPRPQCNATERDHFETGQTLLYSFLDLQ
jgi:hypothetical protein